MKNMRFCAVLITALGFQAAFADPTMTMPQQPNNTYEQAVFGTTTYQSQYTTQTKTQAKDIAKPVNNKAVLQIQDLRRLVKAAKDGNITAANAIKDAANEGDSNAALQYGYLAHTGKLPAMGTNYALAMKAYKKSARQKDKQGQELGYLGNYLATYNIAVMYQQGQGVPQSVNEAYRWFRITNEAYAEQHPNRVFYPAAIQMARALQTGIGTQRDDKAAVQMWLAAVKEGSPDAMVGYANMVAAGRGTIKNPSIAFQYYKRAADKWHLEAIEAMAKLTAKGDGISREPNLKESVKWHIILATVKKKYSGKEKVALSKLSPREQQSAKEAALSWLSSHLHTPEPFDYTQPLYEEPRKY